MRSLKIIVQGLVVSLAFTLFTSVWANENDGVQWLTIEEAQEQLNGEERMVFVYITTDWCSWCRRMEAETFAHPVIASYLNDYFYPVKLNAEQTDPIVFKGETYINSNAGQRRATHDFAVALLQGRMSYPSIAFFDEKLDLLTAIPGFRPPQGMEAVLAFFETRAFEENPDLQEFIANFSGKISE